MAAYRPLSPSMSANSVSDRIKNMPSFRPTLSGKDIEDELKPFAHEFKYLIRYCGNPKYVKAGTFNPNLFTLQYIKPDGKVNAFMLFCESGKICLDDKYTICFDTIDALIDMSPKLNGNETAGLRLSALEVKKGGKSYRSRKCRSRKYRSCKHRSYKYRSRK